MNTQDDATSAQNSKPEQTADTAASDLSASQTQSSEPQSSGQPSASQAELDAQYERAKQAYKQARVAAGKHKLSRKVVAIICALVLFFGGVAGGYALGWHASSSKAPSMPQGQAPSFEQSDNAPSGGAPGSSQAPQSNDDGDKQSLSPDTQNSNSNSTDSSSADSVS